jgi:iron complex transport system substrate-binding protein
MSVLSITLAAALCAPAPEWIGTPAQAPARVVSLAPSLTELVFALGRGATVVGVTRFDDSPPEVKALPRVGGFVDPDPEAVLARRPDVVLAVPVPGTRQRLEVLARLGVPVLLVPAETLDDLWTALHTLGGLLGADAAATRVEADLRAKLEQARVASARARPVRTVVIVGYRPLIAAGPGSFLDGLLAVVNAPNVIARGAPFSHLDLEALAAGAPEVVLDLTMGEPAPEGLWARLGALSSGHPPRIVRLDDEALLRAGPRLGDAVVRLAAALRPAP